jgi:hypothetical protein
MKTFDGFHRGVIIPVLEMGYYYTLEQGCGSRSVLSQSGSTTLPWRIPNKCKSTLLDYEMPKETITRER